MAVDPDHPLRTKAEEGLAKLAFDMVTIRSFAGGSRR